MRGSCRLRLVLLCMFFAFGYSLTARAQYAVSTGSISGQVTDASGAAVPGVAVALTSVSTGVEQTTKTNSTGFYRFSVLDVGTYALSFSKAGFKTTKIENVVVQVGQTAAENVTLTVGEVTQAVTVSAQTPLLRPTEASVSTVVGQSLIQNLPLSGRRYTDFVLLTPNANADGDFGEVSIGGQQGSGDSGYGNGNGANNYTVDGANFTSNFFGGARGRTRVPYVFGEQSIQEFQVSDNPYNAAYGSAGSGFVNTVTKSGTNTWHGNAFYYNRNSGVGNANDPIDNAAGRSRPLDILQQFGADLGGPIVPDKAWFYFDYEQQRRKQPLSVLNTRDAALTVTDFGLAPGTVLPAPNGPVPIPAGFDSPPPPSDMTNYPIYLQQVSNTLNAYLSNLNLRKRFANNISFFPKLDWQPTGADHFTFDYNYSKFDSPGGVFTFGPITFAGDSYLGNNFVRDHHATIHWTHTFGPTLLNDFHVSFTRDEQLTTPSGLIPPTLPQFEIFSPGFIILGNANFNISSTKEYQWQIDERINYVIGKHTLDFGFDFARTHIADFFAGNFNGTYLFFNPTSFALGKYATFRGGFSQSTGNPKFPFTVPYYGFYAQDKFQATKRLTFDFGLREDFEVFPQGQANTTLGPAIAQLTGRFPNQYQRVSPRFGFAYQPFSKTVVRGGFGIFHEVFDGINFENSVKTNGLPSVQSSLALAYNPALKPNQQTVVFPNTLPSTSPMFASLPNITVIDPGFQLPYVMESSLEIQQQVLPNTTLSVGTMWTHGVHIIASTANDLNLCPPQGIPGSANCLPVGTTTYTICPGGFNPGPPEGCIGAPGRGMTLSNLDSGLLTEGRLVPGFPGQIDALISPGNNNYNSFYVQLQQRNFHGLSTLLSYTFSKGLQSNGADFNNQFDFSNTRGPTLLDQRHRLSIAAFYSPGAPGFATGFARGLLSDWTISTVMQFNSGRPYTAQLDFAPSGDSVNNSAALQAAATISIPNSSGGIPGTSSSNAPVPFEGFNSFYGPWINEIDLGISRGFHITERQMVTVTAQVFNLFNHPNFFVQNGGGLNSSLNASAQYLPNGATCGDGATTTVQHCFLTPESTFGVLGSINQLNGPRTFQFAFRYSF